MDNPVEIKKLQMVCLGQKPESNGNKENRKFNFEQSELVILSVALPGLFIVLSYTCNGLLIASASLPMQFKQFILVGSGQHFLPLREQN